MGKPSKSRPVVVRRPDGSIYSQHRVKELQPTDDGYLEEVKVPTDEAVDILKKREKK